MLKKFAYYVNDAFWMIYNFVIIEMEVKKKQVTISKFLVIWLEMEGPLTNDKNLIMKEDLRVTYFSFLTF